MRDDALVVNLHAVNFLRIEAAAAPDTYPPYFVSLSYFVILLCYSNFPSMDSQKFSEHFLRLTCSLYVQFDTRIGAMYLNING